MMKKQSSKPQGNKGRNFNSIQNQAPDSHDDPQRRQPPTPHDIHRVQPVSQNHNKKQPGKADDHKARQGPH